MIEILTDDHYERILDLFDGTDNEIKIISPFISKSISEKLCDYIKRKPNIRCTFITRFYLEDFLSKANNLDALEMMLDSGIQLYAVKGLHTKLYLFDNIHGVLGSANFTAGGFISNVELSLHVEDENELINNLHTYFDDLIEKIKTSDEGIISKELIDITRTKYQEAFKNRKSSGDHFSSFMYGAETERRKKFTDTQDIINELNKCKSETDIVHEMFKDSVQNVMIQSDHTVWLKFGGEGSDRIFGRYPMTEVSINGKVTYLSCYPWKPSAVKEDDEIYMAALTLDKKNKAQPVIIGRGRLQGFSKENHIEDAWVSDYTWMDRYPWYCVIKEMSLLNTEVKNGVPLDEVLGELGSDTYVSSFGKNESVADVSKKHYQKAHIRLTGNAKDFIDKELDKLSQKYGVETFRSELD